MSATRRLAAVIAVSALALAGAGPASADSFLKVTLSGGGSGYVSDPDGVIGCPTRCSQNLTRYFERRSKLTLSASPANGSFFAGWDGICSGMQTTCEIPAYYDATKAVTARFERLPLIGISVLSVDVVGTGSGTVTGPGVDCPGDCAQTYLRDADVTLSAKPAAGSVFAGWFGDYSGLSATCDLHMGGGRTASAVFMPAPAPEPAPLTPGGGGSAAKSRCTVLGTARPDVLIGTRGRDVICGRGGSDTLIGRAGGDVLRGGPGSDLVRAGRGRDTLYARDRRSDQLIGGRGDDRARVDVRKDTRTSIESLF